MDKVKPKKFKVGDWIIFDENHNSIYQIERIDNYRYYLRHYLGGTLSVYFDSALIRQWTIEDAEDGDVLSFNNNGGCIICKCPTNDEIYSYCRYENNSFIYKEKWGWRAESLVPATKEQREQLFKAMHKAGYEWDANKKKLKKIEQHPTTWSADDEKQLNDIIKLLPNLTNRHNWLKSLKDRVQPQNRWKPNKEQIIALRWVLNNIPYNKHKEEISGLLDQIKDL